MPLKIVVEGALSIALSVVLSYFKLFTLPQGGFVSLAFLPLLIFSFRRGARRGVFVSVITGLLHFFLGGYSVHPIQVLLDYPVAYGLIGLAGLFPKSWWKGVICGCFGNFAACVLSGVVFFASYAPKGTNVWLYSIVYNGTYALPECIILMVLAYLIMPRLDKISPVKEAE